MLLKRNLMAMALISAGLCCTAIANAAPADPSGAPTGTGQNAPDQSATPAATSSDDQSSGANKKKAKKLAAVQVNGFVSSIENSIATKRNSNEIVEAVSAEQIGQLPGTSIADTLGRLPGLAVQQVDGRPQVLTIHGLGPDFSTALVNGREQVSTSNNRDVQYDQYPASWFNTVVVNLSPSADIVGQGLAGTVNMQTIRPLEQSHQIAAINANYVWDSLSDAAPGPGSTNKGYKVNGVYVNQFADDTFGVTLGIDLENSPTQIEHQAPWGYATAADGSLVVGGSKNYFISDLLKRKAFLTTLQWKPNDNFTSTLDLTYDNFDEVQQAKGMEFPLAYGSGVTLVPGNEVNGFVQSGTYDNVKPVIRNDYNSTRNKVYNIGWNNKWRIDEDWSVQADASLSRADTKANDLESYSGTGYNVGGGATDTVGFSEAADGMLRLNPTLSYVPGQVVLTDPQGWGAGSNVVQAGFINAPETSDYLASLKLSAQYDFVNGPISNMVFGVDRSTRDKTYNINQAFLILPGASQTLPGATETAPLPSGATTADPLAFMGIGPQVIYNPLTAIADGALDIYPTSLSSIAVPPNWHVREIDTTPYLQFNLDTNLGKFPLRGNFGMQVAHTNQGSQGEYVSAGGPSSGSNIALLPISGGTTYTRYLPSANLVLSLDDSTDLRVGAARVMARPRMDQMSASLGLSANITQLTNTNPNMSYFSASGGNAKLLPTMANNYNISLERYFSGGKGYVSLAAYMLQLRDFINPGAAYLYNFAAYVPAYLTPAQQAQLGTTYGIVSGPTNDGHGYVKGLVGTIDLPFSLITPYLDGFGVNTSVNYTNSSLVYAGNSSPITVPGLSRDVMNNTLYYQKNGFEARVSQSYRSSFLGEVQGISATRILQTVNGGSTYDAQISYGIQSGRFKGLTFVLQGSNLSNKIFSTYQNNDPRQVLIWEEYGRRYEVGVSYKFD